MKTIFYAISILLNLAFFAYCLPLAGAESIAVDHVCCGEAFRYSIEPYQQYEQYKVLRLSWPTPFPEEASEDKTVLGYLYLPQDLTPASPPRTGIVCLDGLGGNGAITGLLAAYFSSSGYPVLLPIAPYTSERADSYGSISKLAKRPDALPLITRALNQMHNEVRRGIDLFTAMPEVRDDKVQIIGASLGAIFASGLVTKEPRIDQCILLVGGGGLMQIVERDAKTWPELMTSLANADPEIRAALDAAVANIEPLNHAEALKAKAHAGKLRMLNAERDEIIPPELSRQLALACDMDEKQEIFPNAGHFTALGYLPRLLPDFANWFADESIPLRVPTPVHSENDDRFAAVCSSLLDLFDPNADGSQLISCDAQVALAKGAEPLYRISLSRKGADFSLKIQAEDDKPLLPGVQLFAIGQSEFPWVSMRDSSFLIGSDNPNNRPLSAYFEPELMIIQNFVTGILLLGNAPESRKALRSLLRLKIEMPEDQPDSVQVFGHGLCLQFELTPSRDGLKSIAVTHEESQRTVVITLSNWQKKCDTNPLPLPEGTATSGDNDEIKAAIALLVNQLFAKVQYAL
ncbi:MAG: acyl-CoA thioester hydrolase/BAAT C-terminal domain-containing protein [Planctomycetia bacterium]|nr:acyl-CoA thioester hydrolase/BAAT C-terminal domain-containing protein [Planctomycetia bacterium]